MEDSPPMALEEAARKRLSVATITMGNADDPDIDRTILHPSDDDDDDDEELAPLRISSDQVPRPEKFCTICNIEIPSYPLHPCRVCLKQFDRLDNNDDAKI